MQFALESLKRRYLAEPVQMHPLADRLEKISRGLLPATLDPDHACISLLEGLLGIGDPFHVARCWGDPQSLVIYFGTESSAQTGSIYQCPGFGFSYGHDGNRLMKTGGAIPGHSPDCRLYPLGPSSLGIAPAIGVDEQNVKCASGTP